MTKRKICVVTGSRAEYGQLYWLLNALARDSTLELQIVVTGMHLSPEFGLTYREIEREFTISEKLEMLLSSDTQVGIAKSIGLGVIGGADILARLSPDILVLPGDRFEILAIAQAALIARIPIAHIQGGELTEGAIDDSIRHALTKLAHLHFVAAEPYRRRVIQMGEHPDTVFNVGMLAIENVSRMHLLPAHSLEEELGFRLASPLFLVTYHPATLSNQASKVSMLALLDALDEFPDATIIFTKANADAGGRILNHLIDEYVTRHSNKARAFTSLGQLRYLSLLKCADAVIGNSSSGITEAPALGVPTVNVGARQTGRIKASSIVDCEETTAAISASIQRVLSREFRSLLDSISLPYGTGRASQSIVEILKTTDLASLRNKQFYDI